MMEVDEIRHMWPFQELQRHQGNRPSRELTQLRSLEHLQFRMRVEKSLHRFDVLLVLESGKHIQVIQGLGQIPINLQYPPHISIRSGPSFAGNDRNGRTYSGSSYLFPPRRLFSNTL